MVFPGWQRLDPHRDAVLFPSLRLAGSPSRVAGGVVPTAADLRTCLRLEKL